MIKISPNLVSKLGSSESKIPLAVKDVFNSAGYTYFSYDSGGSIEGKDRFIDEAGTGLIWLFGIPAYKKLIDKTIYKAAKISPEADIRIIKDKSYLNQAMKYAPSKEILKDLKQAAKNPAKTKSLAIAKFALAMTLTMLSYFGLTKFKQNMTRLNIEKEFHKKMKQNTRNNKKEAAAPNIYDAFRSSGFVSGFGKNRHPELVSGSKTDEMPKQVQHDKNYSKAPAFGSAGFIDNVILHPVNNMILLDLGISGQRIAGARNKGERKEYMIKEGSFLFFVYAADKLIKSGLEKISKLFLKKPVSLDARFLSSDLAEQMLKNEEIQKQTADFSRKFAENKDNKALYQFIFQNQNHAVVQAAEKSGLIETIKDSSGALKIDTRKYIDPKEIKKLSSELNDFIAAGKKSGDITKYLNGVRGLKIVSTFAAIGACCLSLGYLVPKYMQQYRKSSQNGSSDFHVRTQYEKELAAKYSA